MTKTPRPKRAHLERDLIAAQQQRDLALIARDHAREEAKAWKEIAEARGHTPKTGRSMWTRARDSVRGWLSEMTSAVGL